MHQDIINQLKKYKKIEIYKWLIASVIHPSNQKFIIRYELLIHILLAIPENDFLNNRLSRQTFEYLIIRWIEKKYSRNFIAMEDFESFDQTKLIPLLFERKRYYFFYGSLERPYEVTKHFSEMLFSKSIPELQYFKNEFLASLNLQTKILELMINDDEAKIKIEQMYVPSLKSLKKYFGLFKVNKIDENNLHYSLTHYEMGINNFNGLYAKIDNNFFLLLPQCHIEVLYHKAKLYLDQYPVLLSHIDDSFFQRSQKIIYQFFGVRHILESLIKPSPIFNLTEYFNFLVRIDANKILLIKNINPSNTNLIKAINDAASQSSQELEKIKLNPFIGLKHINEENENINFVPSKILEFKIILIYERVSLSDMVMTFEENWKEKDIFIFNFMDISPILELLREKKTDTDVSFMNYLEAEKKQSLYNKSSIMMMDELDSFAVYYENESFPIAGQQPDMMIFVAHEWSSFYNNYLYSKYQDNIYELIEAKYPNHFNIVHHAIGDTYNFMDSALIRGGRCIKFDNRLIWIMYPIAIGLLDIEVKICEFLGQFISFYIDKHKESLFPLFSRYGFDLNKEDFIIEVLPDSLIQNISSLNHLKDSLSTLSKNKINFCTKKSSKLHSLHTFIIYEASSESLVEIFKMDKEQNPEKDVFKNFIVSVLNYFCVENSFMVAQKFIDTYWCIQERAFSFDVRISDNPRLQKYHSPLELQNSFLNHVKQEIVTYLKELHIEPKEYWGEDAKQLNNLIFEFLQNKLENIISTFSQSILYFTYIQIEYIEGKRECDEFQVGLDSSKYIEFDIQEKYSQQRLEISHLAVNAKHVLHTILKVNPQGAKAIVDTDWYYLLALSAIINDTIQRSDYLHYSISETGIEITDTYEMLDRDKSSKIDFHGYHQVITSSKITSAKKNLLREKKQIENDHPQKIAIFDHQLNESWYQDYGFYADDMVVILHSLGSYIFEENLHSPLNFISFDSINDVIQKYIVEPPSPDEIKKMLDFLSLDFNTFYDYKYIDYSLDRLMRKKERINLSPFIKIDNNYLYGNQLLIMCAKTWMSPLLDGDIPFTLPQNSLVKIEVDRIHKTLDSQLEQDAYEIVKKVLGSQYVEKNILNFKRLSDNFIKQPPCGEIDLLIANPKIKTIFVMDAKNMNKKLFNSAIDSELKVFFRGSSSKKSYLEKLNSKVAFVQDNLDEILKYFKITDMSNWKIHKGFVVNELYLSAFCQEQVDFVLLDDLAEYVVR